MVELLVSMVVLTLLVVCAVGVVNAVSNTVTADRQRLEDDAEARRVFDRMSVDFAKMFKRADADSIFASTIGANAPAWDNDKMFFYADSPTYFDLSTQSSPPPQATAGLIGYRVLPLPSGNALPSPAPNYWQLERLGKGLTWDGVSSSPAPGGVVFLTYPAASPSPAAAPTPFPASMLAGGSAGGGAFATTVGTVANNYDDGIDADYHVLSSYVFRLEYCFAMKSLSAAVTASPSPSPTPLFEATSLIPNPNVAAVQQNGFSNVAAIVVAIAILNPQTRLLVPGAVAGQPIDLSKVAAALPTPSFSTSANANPSATSTTPLMAQQWDTAIKAPGFAASAGIPQKVADQIRVYQRYFYLNTPP